LLSVLQLACLLAAVLLLVILPVGDATVLLMLVLALDAAVAALALRRLLPRRQGAAAPIGVRPAETGLTEVKPVGAVGLQLRRRTVPGLRMRRPGAVIAAQVRWRQAAEARRRRAAS
jgi:hypothetical protein